MPRPRTALVIAGLTLGALGCGQGSDSSTGTDPGSSETAPIATPESTDTQVLFRDVTATSGLSFQHRNGRSGAHHLAEITCGGGALAYFDDDGDLDLFLLQGHPLPPEDNHATPRPVDRLYRNELNATGDPLRLTDVTTTSGFAGTGYGCAAATGDVDNDGRVDLLVLNLGVNRLLRNRTHGTTDPIRFEDRSDALGHDDGRSSVGAAFFDFDRDGWLDLYIANNLDFALDDPPRCFDLAGAPDYCGPGAYASQGDRLLRNRGADGGGPAFEDVTARAGLAVAPGPTLGVTTGDLDGDGWPDLYVALDGRPNRLWINQRDGTFREQALLAGSAVNAAGAAEASMGVNLADYDADGDLDIFLAHLVKETNTLYRNDGSGGFDDRTMLAGLGPPSLPFTGFGTRFLDIENDGWLDLVVVNGAVTHIPSLVRTGDPFPLHQGNQLFRNLGRGDGTEVRFTDVTDQAGPAFRHSAVSRGVATGDLGNDGSIDLVVLDNGGPTRVLRNEAAAGAAWLGLRLVAGTPPRDQLGARATVQHPDGRLLTRHARTDGGYGTAHDPRVLFGLGEIVASTLAITVDWPDGTTETFPTVALGRYTTLRRGDGTPRPP